MLTRRVVGKSMTAVCKELGEYLAGWKVYFQIAETPRILADVDKWVRHRLRALQRKHWKRGPTVYRELRARGIGGHAPAELRGTADGGGITLRWTSTSRYRTDSSTN